LSSRIISDDTAFSIFTEQFENLQSDTSYPWASASRADTAWT